MMKFIKSTKTIGNRVLSSSRQLSSSRIAFTAAAFPSTKRTPTHAAYTYTLPYAQHSRSFSTEFRAQTAAVAAANAAVATEKQASTAAGTAAGTKKKAESNVFLDHLGKIFLLGIASVIATLVRSSYNTSNRNEIRDHIEDIAAMDPQELQDFREANSELTIDVLRKVISIYYQEYAPADNISTTSSSLDEYGATNNRSSIGGSSSSSRPSTSYKEFVRNVRTIMVSKFPEHGESFTIQMGHFFDRIVTDVLEQRAEKAASTATETAFEEEEDELPVALFWTALVAAMDGPVSDRIRILHEIMRMEQGQQVLGGTKDETMTIASNSAVVPLSSVRDTVGYLQETFQLPPDTQIVPTEQKYPTQQWRRATPADLVPEDTNTETDNKDSNGVDLVEFAAILRTKSVCVWGECYMKIKPDAREFEEAPGAVASD
mmetsp:Transcript_25709/g.56379  ORF Transcript_25709/g.56379 Transcript_25709/m.56379 type:complete len:431 (+) Transcript_25709:148-1440(+)